MGPFELEMHDRSSSWKCYIPIYYPWASHFFLVNKQLRVAERLTEQPPNSKRFITDYQVLEQFGTFSLLSQSVQIFKRLLRNRLLDNFHINFW